MTSVGQSIMKSYKPAKKMALPKLYKLSNVTSKKIKTVKIKSHRIKP